MIIERKWAMPNKWTFTIKPIAELLQQELTEGLWIDPFAGENSPATITNDLNPERPTNYHMDALDFLKMFETGSVDGVLYDPPYCYDGNAELLTKTGWKNIKEVTTEDTVATLNTQTNIWEWQRPTEVIRKKYCGDMIKVNSTHIKMVVTPNHRCWVSPYIHTPFRWVEAKDLFNHSSRVWFQKTCDWNGEEKEYFTLPQVELIRANRYGEKVKPPKQIPMDLWLKFLGLYLSEGSSDPTPVVAHKMRYRVRIEQKTPYVRKIIEDVLNEMGYNYHTFAYEYSIEDKQLWTYLAQFGRSHQKFIPEEFKNLSKRQLNILIEYLMYGDGCRSTKEKYHEKLDKTYTSTTSIYYTNSPQLMADMCEIVAKSGGCTSVLAKKKLGYRPVYSITLLTSKYCSAKIKDYSVITDYDDYVYCVSVPNTTLLVKYHNSIFWCGNSVGEAKKCYDGFGIKNWDSKMTFWSNQKDEISRIVKTGGKVISFGWNSMGVGKSRGFEITRILLVPHGGSRNDTICTVEVKQ